MQYGYFDEQNREYVITRPDTPAPWVNYLGSPEYGAIISNNATGYSFKKSGAKGRVIRHRFNSLSNDAPGRYFYIKDHADGDYWTTSWAPVCKPLEQFKSECRHGTGYSVISAEYKKIRSEAVYFVPLQETHEVWQLKITNLDVQERMLSVTGNCSFVNHSSVVDDQIDLQCSLFLTTTSYQDNFIYQFHRMKPDEQPVERFFGLADGEVSAYCGNRDKFLGKYRGYYNPEGIEKGLSGDLNYNGNSVGALESKITLQPGESCTLTYVLGQESFERAKEILAGYKSGELAARQLAALKADWEGKLCGLKVQTPDENFNVMVNTWNPYDCYMNFIWSRAASFIYCGLRNGYGYRDTMQDITGIIHLSPELAKERIRYMVSAQTTLGAALPLVKFTHKAGFEDTPYDDSYTRETGFAEYRSDDHLWMFPTIKKYIDETGDLAFLDEEILYANENVTDTLYEHMKKAIDFTANRIGPNGLPYVFVADWNDAQSLGLHGETMFVAFQYVLALKTLKEYAKIKGDLDYIAYLDEQSKKIAVGIEKGFDGDRYIRSYQESGKVMGARGEKEAAFWLNPQSWSVISGYGSRERQELVMDGVEKNLNTPYGAKIFDIPYGKENFPGKSGMSYYNNYTKENASIFCQPQGWLLLAETLLGHGDRAYKYWKEVNPAEYNSNADLRVAEPYVFSQFTEATGTPNAGTSHVHWLTGTAATMMVGVVEGILGLKPQPEGIVIDPSIPSQWKEFTIEKDFRGKKLHITVKNPGGIQNGVSSVTVNGKEQEDVLIREKYLLPDNDIIVTMMENHA